MRVLFTGPLLDFSGFAHVSRNFLRMLTASDRLDVIARPLKYDQLDTGQDFIAPEWMASLLTKPLSGIEMVIQMTTCNTEAVPVPGVVNGLYTFFETNRLQPAWASKANEFDFLMVPSRANAETLVKSGVQKPVLVVAPPCDVDEYNHSYSPFRIENIGNRTVFYNICQLSTKKGIDTLLRAYYAAFAAVPDEVLLVLKTYVNMSGRQNDLDIVKQYINTVKTRCRIPTQNLPPVLPIVYTMNDNEIHGLHERGDAYVCASRAEGWGVPVFDALAHGKTVISPLHGGLADFVKRENALVVGSMPTFFYDTPHPDPGLFTGVEQCFEVAPVELALTMQHFHLLKRGADAGTLDEKNAGEWQSVLLRRENAKTIGVRLDYRVVHEPVVDQLLAVLESWKTTGVARFSQPSVKPSLEESL